MALFHINRHLRGCTYYKKKNSNIHVHLVWLYISATGLYIYRIGPFFSNIYQFFYSSFMCILFVLYRFYGNKEWVVFV